MTGRTRHDALQTPPHLRDSHFSSRCRAKSRSCTQPRPAAVQKWTANQDLGGPSNLQHQVFCKSTLTTKYPSLSTSHEKYLPQAYLHAHTPPQAIRLKHFRTQPNPNQLNPVSNSHLSAALRPPSCENFHYSLGRRKSTGKKKKIQTNPCFWRRI